MGAEGPRGNMAEGYSAFLFLFCFLALFSRPFDRNDRKTWGDEGAGEGEARCNVIVVPKLELKTRKYKQNREARVTMFRCLVRR